MRHARHRVIRFCATNKKVMEWINSNLSLPRLYDPLIGSWEELTRKERGTKSEALRIRYDDYICRPHLSSKLVEEGIFRGLKITEQKDE